MDKNDKKNGISCKKCKIDIDVNETRYHCNICDFFICENCFFGETNHKHNLVQIRKKESGKLLYTLKDSETGNKLLLGDYRAAFPDSPIITSNNVKAVLSLIEFEGETAKLEDAVWGSRKKPMTEKNGIVYYHITVPDLQNPALLKDYKLEHLLERCVHFVNEGLKRGDVLVHCEQGRRRSPTIILAWMVTRGKTVNNAIDTLSKGYNSKDFQTPNKSWAEMYRGSRSLWIDRLNKWLVSWREDTKKFIQKHKSVLNKWERFFERAKEGSVNAAENVLSDILQMDEGKKETEDESVKRKVEDEILHIVKKPRNLNDSLIDE